MAFKKKQKVNKGQPNAGRPAQVKNPGIIPQLIKPMKVGLPKV